VSGDQAGTGADAAAADAMAFAVAPWVGGSSWAWRGRRVRASPRWPSPWSGMPGRGRATPDAYFPMNGHHLANAQLARLGLEPQGARAVAFGASLLARGTRQRCRQNARTVIMVRAFVLLRRGGQGRGRTADLPLFRRLG